MKILFFAALLLIFFSPFKHIQAQADSIALEIPDSILEKQHSPTKATLMSLCLPGLGQVYNKKYWKVPIVYAGLGVFTYFIITNADSYITYKCAYIESVNGNKNGNYAALVQKYTSDELLSAREYYRRNLEISCIFTALWYALQVLDATVDAHLYTFNISDKLSLRLQPSIQPIGYSYGGSAGFKLSLKF
jgi:hypothetical protein